jgi:hypothetical protein
MISTVFVALAPALQATRIELVRAVRGEVVRDARPGRARDALVALQVTASVLLLVCAAVFLRSSWAAASVDPGIRTSDTMVMRVLNEERRASILDIVRSEPSVVSVAASWPGGLGGRPAVADGFAGKAGISYQFVSPEYFGVLGIDIIRGRGFTAAERIGGAAVAVVSEGAARQLWPARDAIGQIVRLEADSTNDPREPGDPGFPSGSFTIVGVARDVAGFRLGGARLGVTVLYVPIDVAAARTGLTVRVRGDSERARHVLVDRLAAIDPNMSEVATLKSLSRMEAYLLGIPFWLTLVLGALALLLTLSGLFGVLSYLVAQRTREIGVRVALGATRRNIATLVLWQSARPVCIGLLLGSSLAAALGIALLATDAAESIGSSVRLFDPIAYAASLFCILTACTGAALIPALRAGQVEPLAALRQD